MVTIKTNFKSPVTGFELLYVVASKSVYLKVVCIVVVAVVVRFNGKSPSKNQYCVLSFGDIFKSVPACLKLHC